MVATLLSLVGGETRVSGSLLTLSGFTVRIIPECTPLFVLIVFVSFILAYPATWKDRGWGFLLGILVLIAANLLRLALLISLGVKYPGLFEVGHVYLGQFVMVFLVFLVSLVWVRQIHEPPGSSGSLAFLIRFLALSPLFFLAWLYLNKGYVMLGDRMISFAFGLFDYRLVIPRTHHLYYHTFNLAVFCTLMLSTRSVSSPRRIRALAAGLLLLSSIHLLVRLGNVLATGFGIPPAIGIANALHVFGMFALPLILWIGTIRQQRDVPAAAQ
jgi:exosortase/archaeosortase family protein